MVHFIPWWLADLSWSIIPSIHLYFLVLFGIVIVFVARCTIYTTFQSARSTVNITIVNCIYHTNAVQMYCILENHPSWLLQNACQTHPEVRRSHNIMKRYTWEDDRLSSWVLSTYWRELLSVVVHIIWIHCLATDASIMHSFITTCCHHITSHHMALSLAPLTSDLTIQDDFQTVPKRIWLGLRYLKETEAWMGSVKM